VVSIFLTPEVDKYGYLLHKTKNDVSALNQAIELYKLDNHRYPSENEGLIALLKNEKSNTDLNYIKRLPPDSWGSAYIYKLTKKGFKVYSSGPNKIDEGGLGDDVVSWKKEYRCEDFNDCMLPTEKLAFFMFPISLFLSVLSALVLLIMGIKYMYINSRITSASRRRKNQRA